MERSSRGPSINEIMADLGATKKALQDTTSLLALIAWLQDDHRILVSVEELEKLPKGSFVDVSFDKDQQAYVLQWQPADAPELPKVEIKSSIVI